jgi:hypothetical protein
MAAITDLSSASSIAATDYFVVNQSGTDRKALANKLPLLTVANTFTAAQTFSDEINVRQHTTSNLWSIDAANGTPLTLANTFVYQFSSTVVFTGMILLSNATGGATALFVVGGGVVAKVADGSNVYSTTKDTASKLNLYYDAGSGEYRLQNLTGSSATLSIVSIRVRAAS